MKVLLIGSGKNSQKRGFLTTFLTKSAFFDVNKNAFVPAKSFGA